MTCDYIKLQQSGQAYPRTCPECGLGLCKYRTMTAPPIDEQIAFMKRSSWPTDSLASAVLATLQSIKDAVDVVEPLVCANGCNFVSKDDYDTLKAAYKRVCVERDEIKRELESECRASYGNIQEANALRERAEEAELDLGLCKLALEQKTERLKQCEVTLTARESERDEFRKDAERYRWLVDNKFHHMAHPNGDGWGISDLIYGDDIDYAIDSARNK